MKRTIFKIWTAIVVCVILLAVGCDKKTKTHTISFFKDSAGCYATIFSDTLVVSVIIVPCDKCDEYIKADGK